MPAAKRGRRLARDGSEPGQGAARAAGKDGAGENRREPNGTDTATGSNGHHPPFDPETGEVIDCPRCLVLLDQVAGLQRDVLGWTVRYRNLARDREQEARAHESWDEVKDLFDYWRKECHHGQARFNADRFWLALPFVEKDGSSKCRVAIDGAAFDPYVTGPGRNGKYTRHDGWELIFKARKQFDAFVEKAPHRPPADEFHRVAAGFLERMPEDDRPTEDRVVEATQRASRWFRSKQGQAKLAEIAGRLP